ncbi:UNVERIFIED_CONTAM: Serine/threonine-protein kinase rio2 [Sesamum radiatum]|uniref:Serine/threonine-protein kinase RIO2 n=1 Tax=Sesamum radiatum TaxID=300843 RepID=A0AAW2SJ06_SESRA
MKLDVDALRYLSKDDFRVLTAVEMGMRNHEIVPSELIDRIASLKHGGTYKVLKNLLKHKLLHHDSSKYDGFRLTYLGYDFLAIKTLVNRGVFAAVGRQIGVGKESDIFEVATEDGTVLAMKLHRLGRVSFRAVKSKRDYLRHRSSYNWLYLSRLAALKEFAFMKALDEHGFPVPHAVDCNRHCVIMSLIQGYPLVQVKQLQNPDTVFETILGLIVRLAEHGLIHCDFNEFNIMIDDDEKVTMIDFPQMVSVSHRNAKMYFDRDVECIFKFFRKRFNINSDENEVERDDSEVDSDEDCRPQFSDIKKASGFLDKELEASGFTRKDQDDMEKFVDGDVEEDPGSDSEETEDEQAIVNQTNDDSIKKFESLSLVREEEDDLPEVNLENGQHIMDQDTLEEHSRKGHNPHENKPVEHENNAGDEAQVKHGHDSEEDEQTDDDPELVKRLSKQRQRAIQAARGRRKLVSYKKSKENSTDGLGVAEDLSKAAFTLQPAVRPVCLLLQWWLSSELAKINYALYALPLHPAYPETMRGSILVFA